MIRIADIDIPVLQHLQVDLLIELVLESQLPVGLEVEVASKKIRGDQQPRQTQQHTTLAGSVATEPVDLFMEEYRQRREQEHGHGQVVAELVLLDEVNRVRTQMTESQGTCDGSDVFLEAGIREIVEAVVKLIFVSF